MANSDADRAPCAVLGAGAWGTALADLLARNGHRVRLWAREADVVESITSRRENARFLPGFRLHESLEATDDLATAARDAAVVVYASPSQVLRAVAKASCASITKGATVLVASKGIETGSLLLMTDVVAEELRECAVVAVSGPSFAAEVAARQPTAIVAASSSPEAALQAQQALSSREFRVYTHADVTGVELGGSLKNVLAVATGIAEGVGLGYNPRAALITRGLAEMTRLGIAMGAQPATFAGLAGIGDLVLTCTGPLSRNRSVGVEIGKGVPLAQVLAGRDTVAEGVENARNAAALALRHGVDMPIVRAVTAVLFDGHAPREAIERLMARDLRAEQDA